jgi:hypothetical protein
MIFAAAWDIALGFNSAPISAPWISSRTSSPGRGGVWILTGTRDAGWLSTWSVEHTSHYFYLYHHFGWWNALHITSIIVVWWNPPFWFYATEIIQNPPVSFLEAAMSTTAAPIITTCSGGTSGPAASCATARKKSGLLSGDGLMDIDGLKHPWKRENWRLFIIALPTCHECQP